jgi:hypothetical protein
VLFADNNKVPDPALVIIVSVLMIPEASDEVLFEVMDNVPMFATAPLISTAPEPVEMVKLFDATLLFTETFNAQDSLLAIVILLKRPIRMLAPPMLATEVLFPKPISSLGYQHVYSMQIQSLCIC